MPRTSDTRQRIYDQALELFGKKGFEAASIRELAAAAGIRESSIYNHFSSKQALLDAMVEDLASRIGNPGLIELRPDDWRERSLASLLKEGVDIFLASWRDAQVRRLWTVLAQDQYRNPAAAMLLLREQEVRLSATEAMFASLIRRGLMRPGAPRALAEGYVLGIYSLKIEYILRTQHGLKPEDHERRIYGYAEGFAGLWERTKEEGHGRGA
jgi:AcrR family transcriptional regulator